ncbi:MAG TPA: STAS domain-containing protein, partial [Roseomonas sp.]|nr:STAS domain-containing protein [Roseomonas sp.]
MEASLGDATAQIEALTEGGSRVLRVSGRIDIAAAARLWPQAMKAAQGDPIGALDLSDLESIDSAGAVMLLTAAPDAELRGAPDQAAAVLERTRKALATIPPPGPPPPWHPITAIGRATVGKVRNGIAGIAFMGEALVTILRTLARPRLLRWPDVLRHLDEVGTRAFPLTLLLGFLI